MSDGSQWSVPVDKIAADRAVAFANVYDGDVGKSYREGTIPLFEANESEIHEWAANNMDWKDVQVFAKKVSPSQCNYADGWVNGEFEIK